MGNVYGYIRVSSKDQNEDRQVITMHKMQVPVENIYIDKQSGKDFNRPQYRRLLRRVKADDLIYIKSIDRLGRNYTEILINGKLSQKTSMLIFISWIHRFLTHVIREPF